MLYFYDLIGKLDYVFISATALWGLYCAILVISRVATKRFKSEAEQEEFLEAIEPDRSWPCEHRAAGTTAARADPPALGLSM